MIIIAVNAIQILYLKLANKHTHIQINSKYASEYKQYEW